MAANHSIQRPPAGTSGWRVATWSLRYPTFRWIYASNLAFFFAMNGQFVVRSFLAYDLTDRNANALGLINLVVAIPMLVISPIGGVLADRFDRRKLILGGQLMVIANELAVATLLITGLLEFWHLLAAVFVMGCTFPFIMPARQAIVANVVGREGLSNAMALTMGGINAARIAGPALAGFLIAGFGAESTYITAIALYVLAVVSMSRVGEVQDLEEREKRPFRIDLADGFRFVAGNAPVRALMLLSIVPILFAMPFQALLVVFAEDVWHEGARGLGILNAMAGFGGIAGSVWVAWRGDPASPRRVMLANSLLFGGTLFLFAISPWFWVAVALVIVADAFANIFNTANATSIQALIPDAVRGRVMSLMMMTFGLTPLGTLPVSFVAERWGAPVAVAGASLAMVAVIVLLFTLLKSLREIDRDVLLAREERPLREGGGRAPSPQPAPDAAG